MSCIFINSYENIIKINKICMISILLLKLKVSENKIYMIYIQ